MVQLFDNTHEFISYSRDYNPDTLFNILIVGFFGLLILVSYLFGRQKKTDEVLAFEAIKPIGKRRTLTKRSGSSEEAVSYEVLKPMTTRRRARINACLALNETFSG